MIDHSRTSTAALTLAAMGVVFGDIGTSPLYAFKVCFHLAGGLPVTPANVLGLLSLILWALIIIIAIKYVALMLRADNRGEGGVLALMALVLSGRSRMPRQVVVVLALAGTALFFADGAITPAISVLSAVEGLALANPGFQRAVLPIVIIILVGLFAAQSRGTGSMGRLFGPITLLWFLVLAALGLSWIVERPEVLAAINPSHAIEFIAHHQGMSVLVMSAVFLAVTGGEALYADMGHFGPRAIRIGWYGIAMPALMLNYLGQGARVLADPAAIESPFYLMSPGWALPWLVLLATVATVVASQAVISGVFSLARQAMLFGFLPRFRVLHSSAQEAGQIYVPAANWLMLIATLVLVLAFGSSEALAGAYGIAISAAMAIDSLLLVALLVQSNGSATGWLALAALSFILPIDLMFVAANSLRIPSGGWVPLAMAAVLMTGMLTWRDGRALLLERLTRRDTSVRDFLRRLAEAEVVRTPGCAIYLDSRSNGIPRPLQRTLDLHGAVAASVLIVSIRTLDRPYATRDERIAVSALGAGIQRIIASHGFMESFPLSSVLEESRAFGVDFRPEVTSYVLGRHEVVVTRSSGMSPWRKRLFALMMRNSQAAVRHYGVPPHRAVEFGTPQEI